MSSGVPPTPAAAAHGSAAVPRVALIEQTFGIGAGRVRLTEMLGAQRLAALEGELIGRALMWAESIAPGRVTIAPGGADGGRVTAALTELFAQPDGPWLAVWPELPRWPSDLADAILGDLADGCDLSCGPVFDGGFYAIAFSRPIDELTRLDDEAWNGPDPIALAIAAAERAGLAVGMLRPERGLSRPEDVHALLADPLLDAGMRRLLG